MLSLRRARSIETEAGAKKEFKVPHTLVIISFILVIVAVGNIGYYQLGCMSEWLMI